MYKAAYLLKPIRCDDIKNVELSSCKNFENLLNIQNGGSISTILNSLNAHNFPTFQLIFKKLISKFLVYRALTFETYLFLGLWFPLSLLLKLFRVGAITVFSGSSFHESIILLLSRFKIQYSRNFI